MSERGQRGDLGERVAAIEEFIRRLRHNVFRGPIGFTAEALVSRGTIAGTVETGDYAGVPSGDPYFFLARITDVTLEAGRWYALVGLTEVDKVAAGSALLNVNVVRDATYAVDPPSVGEGVTAHTLVRRNRHLYSGTGNDHSVDIVALFEQATDETGVEFALIVETGLEPTGGSDHTIALIDMGTEG